MRAASIPRDAASMGEALQRASWLAGQAIAISCVWRQIEDPWLGDMYLDSECSR